MDEKIVLIIGSGGIEDAICWKLGQSESVEKIFVLPGNHHIATRPKVELIEDVAGESNEAIIAFCKSKDVDLVFVGSRNLLFDGIADVLIAANIRCFGPTSKIERFEGDKSWTKNFMVAANIPTARYGCFDNADAARAFIHR